MSLRLWRRSYKSRPPSPTSFGPLVPGWRYEVVRGFRYHDGIEHAPGERWRFDRHSFLPYEDGLSLFVTRDDGGAGLIRLQARPEAEGRVAWALEDYLLPVASRADRHALLLTRDSLCMAEDIDASHAALLKVAPDADAADVARAILHARYLAWTSTATWSLALASDQVVFGWRMLRQFVKSVPPGPFEVAARAIQRVHVSYHAQEDPKVVVARRAGNMTR